ncbi:MAG: hypothetical protein A2W01_07750 [Candidatus Solincola sediminis]|uniref:Uncharacterized protein n=1 Tax=Candidatus Solincola sediminis TaxID=1797199 RepID=A0A1F2WQZ3_9ACTN|nr:MAG: hypothetical protein A2Y75_01695 [Candidatus Solincola sediminis]OFW61564.1 MAG: hypothetical protein A2W01_07750 [Candidatus Solincola sediminis]
MIGEEAGCLKHSRPQADLNFNKPFMSGGTMVDNSIEIGGEIFDLADPEQKKAAIRAWLKAKAREKEATRSATPIPDDPLNQTPAVCGTPQPPESLKVER